MKKTIILLVLLSIFLTMTASAEWTLIKNITFEGMNINEWTLSDSGYAIASSGCKKGSNCLYRSDTNAYKFASINNATFQYDTSNNPIMIKSWSLDEAANDWSYIGAGLRNDTTYVYLGGHTYGAGANQQKVFLRTDVGVQHSSAWALAGGDQWIWVKRIFNGTQAIVEAYSSPNEASMFKNATYNDVNLTAGYLTIGSYRNSKLDDLEFWVWTADAEETPTNQTPNPLQDLVNISQSYDWVVLDSNTSCHEKCLLYQDGVNVVNFTSFPYNRTGLTENTGYLFNLTVYNSSYTTPISNFSNTVSVTTLWLHEQPPTITDIAVDSYNNRSIYLTWTASGEAEKYLIYNYTTNLWNDTTANYNVTGLDAGVTYNFSVRIYNSSYSITLSNFSDYVQQTTSSNMPINQTPTPTLGEQILTEQGTSHLNIFHGIQFYEEKVLVYNSTDNSTFTNIMNLSVAVATFNHTGLSNNTKYYYKFKTYNSTYTIAQSNFTIVINYTTAQNPGTTETQPTTITNLLNTSQNNQSIYLTWTGGGAEKYLLYNYTGNIANTTNSYYNVTNLNIGATYNFSIRGYNSSATTTLGNISNYVITSISQTPTGEEETPATGGGGGGGTVYSVAEEEPTEETKSFNWLELGEGTRRTIMWIVIFIAAALFVMTLLKKL